jgi:hypothetical protein
VTRGWSGRVEVAAAVEMLKVFLRLLYRRGSSISVACEDAHDERDISVKASRSSRQHGLAEKNARLQ